MEISFLVYPSVLILGLLSGMIINYLSDVLPHEPAQLHPKCTNCREEIAVRNYLFWPSECNHCNTSIPFRKWWVLLISITFSIFLTLSPTLRIPYLAWSLIFLCLGSILVIDIEHRIIPYSLVIMGAVIGFVVGYIGVGIAATIFGGFVGAIVMLAIYLLGILFVKISNRWRNRKINQPALGFGDVLLGGVLGLMIGWPDILNSLMLSILIAGAFSILYLIFLFITKSYRFGTAFPYAPFLIIAAFYVIIFPI